MKIERILFATATIMLAASATASAPAAEISCVKLYDEKGWGVMNSQMGGPAIFGRPEGSQLHMSPVLMAS
jgi:hypothetical protein